MTLLQRLKPEIRQKLEESEKYFMSTEKLFSQLEKLQFYTDMPYIVYSELLQRTRQGTTATNPIYFFTESNQ